MGWIHGLDSVLPPCIFVGVWLDPLSLIFLPLKFGSSFTFLLDCLAFSGLNFFFCNILYLMKNCGYVCVVYLSILPPFFLLFSITITAFPIPLSLILPQR